MKKRIWIWLELTFSAVFAVSFLLSGFTDDSPVARNVFAHIALLAFAASVVAYIFEPKKGGLLIPSFIISSLIFGLLFNNDDIFYTQTENSPTDPDFFPIMIFIAGTLAAITALIKYIKTSPKDVIISFLLNTLVYFLAGWLMVFFINYAFDPSVPSKETFVITELTDTYTSRGDDTYTYSVEYIGDNKDVSIKELDLDMKYKFEEGDHITVKFRKGLFFNIYKADYSNAKPNDSLDS